MLIRLLIFELYFYSKQLSFRLAIPIFFLLGLISSAGGMSMLSSTQNAPIVVAFTTGILSLGTPIMIALFAGSAILRDAEHRMASLVYTTRITRFNYLVSRFLGLFLSSCLAFTPAVLGFMLGHVLKFHPNATFGPIEPFAYLWSTGALIFPNIFFGCAVIFCTAALTKHSAATYLSGIFLYMLYFTGSMLGNSPLLASSTDMQSDQLSSATLMDPYGLIGIFQQAFFWTDVERQSAFLILEGPLLFNRLLWMGFSLILFATTYHLYTFRIAKTKTRPNTREEELPTTVPGPVGVHPQPNQTNTHLQTWWRQARMDLRSQVLSLPFWGFMLLWLFYMAMTIAEHTNPVGMDPRPFTFILLQPLHPVFLKLGTLIIAFYAAELLWYERRIGVASLVEACPVPNVTFWAGKITAIAGIVLLFLTLTLGVVILFQWSRGIFHVHWLFLWLTAVQMGVPLFLCGVFALVIQAQVPSKYGGLAISLIIIVAFSGVVLDNSFFLEHPMLRFAFTPPLILSQMAEAAFHDQATQWFLTYWAAIAGFLSVLTLLFWKRGSLKPRILLGKGHVLAFSFFTVLLMISAAVLFYRNNIYQPYRTEEGWQQWQADYERRYDALSRDPQPIMTAIDAKVDLFPNQRAFEIEAVIQVENPFNFPLETALVGLSNEVTSFQLDLEKARLTQEDAVYKHHQYSFQPSLAPGESRQLTYKARIERTSFQVMNRENYILPKAAYIEIEKLIPFFGFMAGRTLDDVVVRERMGLPSERVGNIPDEFQADHADWMQFRMQISTTADQTVIAPGDLETSWEEGGRRHFIYASNQPLPIGLGIASGIYEATSRAVDGIDITYYHAADQPYFAEEILDRAVEALKYCQEAFGPYPFKTYQIAAIPSFSNGVAGTAYSGIVFLVEDRVLLQDQRPGEMNMITNLMAHETAHQWWGRLLNPANAKGAAVLSETLANYCELVIAEAEHGRSETLANLQRTADLYFLIRSFETGPEQTLSQLDSQIFVAYNKGTHVVHGLRELLGEDTINRALRQLLDDFPYPKKPVVGDLIDRLLAVAPAETHSKIHEWFDQVVTYDLRVTDAEIAASENGFEANLDILATRKDETTHLAPESSPLMAWVEVALMDGQRLVKRERFFADKQQMKQIFFSKKPFDRVVIDPNRIYLDPSYNDNSWTFSSP